MIDARTHVPLASRAWDAVAAQGAVEEIVEDACAHFDVAGFWPAHPQDGGASDGDTSLYLGASGVIWALHQLATTGATQRRLAAPLARLLAAARQSRAALGEYGRHGSLHFGDFPALLVAMRLAPDAAIADAIHQRASDNNALPVRELMWGLPGSMLACVFMHGMTGEAR